MALLTLLLVALLAGCGGGAENPVSPASPAPETPYGDGWEEDDPGDNAQVGYEDGWSTGYPEGCEAIFADSPDGVLYSSGIGYEAWECEGADPGPGEWDSYHSGGDPWSDGARDGWNAACEETFVYLVGDDLYWGDNEVWVSQSDCELANPY